MKDKTDLFILWTSDNPVTAEKMVFMYGINSILQGWWEKVTILIWGSASLLVSGNPDIQKKVREAQETGVHVIACKACADQLDVTGKLEKLGIEVEYTGKLLTDILKSEEALITI